MSAAVTDVDLDWDHSAGENLLHNDETVSDIFNPGFHEVLSQDGTSDTLLKRRQLVFLLRTLTDAGDLIREHLHLQRTYMTTNTINQGNQDNQASSCNTICKNRKIINALIGFIGKWVFLVILICQMFSVAFISIMENISMKSKSDVTNSSHEGVFTYQSCTALITINVICLFFFFFLIVRIVSDVRRCLLATFTLVQAYLSVILIFTGFYTTAHCFNENSWSVIGEENWGKQASSFVFIYLLMCFHSISTSTLCGASAIVPKQWYSYFLMSVQMLLSISLLLWITSCLIVANSGMISTPAQTQHRARRQPSISSMASQLSAVNPLT